MKPGGLSEARLGELREIARKLRVHILRMVGAAGSGHPGGSLSAVEIVTALFFHVMQLNPDDPGWEDRDRFVLSKGHAAPVLYAALAERGFFDPAELLNLRKLHGFLQGHPSRKDTPGVEVSTGSLGQGLAMANGMALAGKVDGRSFRVYALLGDGESQEGMVWEAAMAAAHYRLDNLTAFLDFNKLQIDGPVAEVMGIEPLREKWMAFGWNVLEVPGHDLGEIIAATEEAQSLRGKPTMIIASTIKGKGVSFMENEVDWHGRAPNKEQVETALRELGVGDPVPLLPQERRG